MDEHCEEEETQLANVDGSATNKTPDSNRRTSKNDLNTDDSDDGMEIDTFHDTKNDSELIDSDVNAEATELTGSDPDISEESDLKGDLSSDMDSNPNSVNERLKSRRNKSDGLESDEEETFELELKDGKEDSVDEDSDKGGHEGSHDEDGGNINESNAIDTASNEMRKTRAADKRMKTEANKITENAPDKGKGDSAQMHHKDGEDNVSSSAVENNIDDQKVETEFDEIKNENSKRTQPTSSKKAVEISSNDEVNKSLKSSTNLEGELKKESESTMITNIDQTPDRCDSSDDSSDFIGFDSSITNETRQIYNILQENHKELVRQLQKSETKNVNDSVMEVDEPSITEPPSEPSKTVSDQGSSMKDEVAVSETPQESKTSDEQSSNNSKRIKKKRKFFDEFDENEAESQSAKRPHLTKERESTSSIDNSLSENKENFMSADKISIKDETLLETSSTSSIPVSSTPNPPKAESKGRFDITNPDFKEPFKYGWKREVVYRFISEDGRRRSADVSYFTPQGKKLRSTKQIIENLPSDGSLHIKNFTFSKELVFRNRESELEITRCTKKMEAELRTNDSETNDSVLDKRLGIESASSENSLKPDTDKKPAPKKKEAQVKSKSNVKNQSLPGSEPTATKSKSSRKGKNAETDAEESSNATPKLAMPKILIRGPNVNSNTTPKTVTTKPATIKIRLPSSKSSNQKTVRKVSKPKFDNKNVKKLSKSSGDIDTSLPLDWKTPDQRNLSPGSKAALNTSVSSSSKSNRGSPACSISCPSALGTIPTLQCTICLCLFHFQCCGLDADRPVNGYVCKNCRMCERKKENVQPPYKTVQRSTHSPKRLYPVDHYDSLAVSVNDNKSPLIPKNTKIVDGVTTWLPSSSNIRLKNSSTFNASSTSLDVQSPLVQGVLELDGRRYVVVPKQSVLSVSPNASATFIESHTLCERNTMSSVPLCEGAPNTLLVNPSDVNSAGVVLVPVTPPNNTTSPRQIPSSRYLYLNNTTDNRVKFPDELNAASIYGINCNSINGASPGEMSAYQSGITRHSDYSGSFTLSNISRMYDPLLMSLKYLTVRDLLRISMTSKFLNRIASDPFLWKTVRLRNSQVYDWDGFAKALQKYGTKRLDMRKMLCSNNPDDVTTMWNNFLEVISSITSLEHIDFSRAPASVVDSVAATCRNLSVINALYLKNGSLLLDNFAQLEHLTELRLKGVSGIQLERNLPLNFINRENLREISLTSVRNLDMDVLKMISEATNLVTLELGECSKLPADFATETISKLTNLEKLRLEKLQELAPKYEMFEVIKDMSNLKYLELINIEVKEGFDDALALCKNLEHFLIIPTYLSQSATTNQLIINGIKRLSDTIKSFVWGLTLELLKVTDLFMDQWQQKGNNTGSVKKAVGDSIPILKAVDKVPSDGDTVPTHVDILPVPKLEKMLITLLPNSRVKVVKIPFQMTWRQCLSECLK